MDNPRKQLINIILLSILSINLTSCQYFTMKEYKYDAYASCDDEYPITAYSSSFHTLNSFLPLVGPTGKLIGTWGSGGADVVGDGFNEVPKDLRIHFYSDTEDKFYESTFDLPSEEIEKMLQEESTDPSNQGKTFDDSQSGRKLKYMKYDQIIAGVSLGGEVTVWMAGMREQKLIATYYAKEVPNVKWENISEYGSREKRIKYNMSTGLSEKVKQEIKSNALPYTLWQTYKEKYNWAFRLIDTNGEQLNEIYFRMINAEEESVYSNNPLLNNDPPQSRAIPYFVELRWQDASRQKYIGRVMLREDIIYYLNRYHSEIIKDKNPQDFQEEEIFKAFNSLDKSKPIEILFKVNGSNKECKVIVKQESKEIPLTKIFVRVFED
ncbi:DUF2931 family protein [Flavobacterium sp. EDS]|uniref:DUF2931 family protein n=1 Tax=Flavobacterium sp. EDS TaxID=2897328 RepID=UPI001E29ADEA|nr:DUF2931 family protein [Flavobacterium sp. EDS]MCD0476594.1 DUF2931 family protein [Flavobacterium sp. EDS]